MTAGPMRTTRKSSWQTGTRVIAAGQRDKRHTVDLPDDLQLSTFRVQSSGGAVRVVGIIVQATNDEENIVEVTAWAEPLLVFDDSEVGVLRPREEARANINARVAARRKDRP